jgi:hypothetical protein
LYCAEYPERKEQVTINTADITEVRKIDGIISKPYSKFYSSIRIYKKRNKKSIIVRSKALLKTITEELCNYSKLNKNLKQINTSCIVVRT